MEPPRQPERARGGRPYHRRVVSPFVLAAALVVGFLALAPARRLFLAGRSSGFVTAYFLSLWLLGLLAVLSRGGARVVLPLIVVLYIAPFITWRAGIDRLLGRRREVRPPPRNVTPPAERDEAAGTR